MQHVVAVYVIIHGPNCVELIIVDSNPEARTTLLFHTLHGQDQSVLFWHGKGLSSSCTLCEFTCLNPE